MLEKKVEQTIENCKHIEILEEIIKNPNKKIEEIIKEKNIFFNGYKLDLVISLSQFLINKDQTITKSGRTENERFTNWLLDKYIETYNFDDEDITLNDFIDRINIIRNNIAHGKYLINDETLDLEFLDSNAKIKYQTIKELIETKFVNNKNKLKKLPIKTGYIQKVGNSVSDINNLNDTLKNYFVFDYEITSTSEDFDPRVLEIIQNEIEKIKNYSNQVLINKEDYERYTKAVENCKNVAVFGKINFQAKIYSLDKVNTTTLEKIDKVVEENKSKLENQKEEFIKIFLEGCMNDFYFDSSEYMQIDKAMSQIKKLSLFAHNNKNLNYNELKNIKRCLPPTDNQMLLATSLAKFNVLFSYNNENIYKELLDFSKLNLQNINPSICVDINTSAYKNEELKILSLEKDVDDDSRRYKSIKGTKFTKEGQKKAAEKVNLRIYDKLFQIIDIKKEIKNIKYDHKDNIEDEEKYIKNKLIVMHLRNAITHGHIIMQSRIKNNDLKTCILTFEDFNIETGEKTFELTTNLEEISKITDYNSVLNKIEKKENIFNKHYNGFSNFLILISIVTLEASIMLFYAILKFQITLR